MEEDVESRHLPFFFWACLVACLVLLGLSFVNAESLLSLSPVANSQLGRRVAGAFSQDWFSRALLILSALYGLAAIASGTPRIRGWISRMPVDAPLAFRTTLLLALGLVLVLDGPATRAFFFRYDDFEFIRDVIRVPLPDILFMRAGDTACPVLWLAFSVLWRVCGTDPLGWSLFIRVLLVGILVSGMWVIREFGGRRAAQILFLLLCGVWTGWGAYLSAYACLSIYMMVLLAALVATGALLAWHRTGQVIWKRIYLTAVLALPLLHLSSAWVYIWIGLLVLGLQAEMVFPPSKPPADEATAWKSRIAWIGLGASFGLLLALNVHALMRSGRPAEFVEASATGIPSLVSRAIVYLLGIPYALLSPGMFPYFEQHGLRLPFLLGLACVGILSLVLSLVVLKREGGRILVLFGMTLSAIALMVAQGRQAESPYFLWQEKYLAFAFVWAVLLLGILWQYAWNRMGQGNQVGGNRQASWFLQGTGVLLAGYLGIQLGVDLTGEHARHLHVGRRYWAGVSLETRAALSSLRERFSYLDAAAGPVTIPDLPLDSILMHAPILGPYDLSDFAPFVFDDWQRVTLLPVPGVRYRRVSMPVQADTPTDEAFTAFRHSLRTSPGLRELYMQIPPALVTIQPVGDLREPIDRVQLEPGSMRIFEEASMTGEGLRILVDGGVTGGVLHIRIQSGDGLPPTVSGIRIPPGRRAILLPVQHLLAWQLRGDGRRISLEWSRDG